jgi:hypothetical protein
VLLDEGTAVTDDSYPVAGTVRLMVVGKIRRDLCCRW